MDGWMLAWLLLCRGKSKPLAELVDAQIKV
jgi:hypothetical protein